VGSGVINATLKAVGGTLNVIKLDIQTGVGNDSLGWLLAQFTFATDATGGSATFDFRGIPCILDRNFADAAHRFLYLPVQSATGTTWLNNNLGADYANLNNASFKLSQQATVSTDPLAYGSYFQWGRYADGHEFSNSTTASGPVASGTEADNFIINNSDWLSTPDDNLWNSGTEAIPVKTATDPCPSGYRVPTETEFTAEIVQFSTQDSAGAFASPLKLTLPGNRASGNGILYNGGSKGYYWSGTVFSFSARTLFIDSSTASIPSYNRSNGYSVRCVKD